jgi:peptidoglycan L-alanyl-D-glutamate endopeptidase CwlK
MPDRSLDDLDPELKLLCQQWLDKCQAQQINARVIETYRSVAEQNADYAVGRDEDGNVIGKTITKAKGGQSKHNATLADGTPASKAFDFVIINDDGSCNWNPATPQWKAAVAIAKDLGLVWGGDFPAHQYDADHLELAS